MSFKKTLCIVSILAVLILSMSVPCWAAERVGVLGFSGKGDSEYQLAAVNQLTKILFSFGRYELVERVEMDRILKEQRFQLSGLVDPSTAVEVGRILGLSQVYIGSIDQLSASFDKRQRIYHATAKVTVKLIEVETGKILNIFTGAGSSSDGDYRTALHSALNYCFNEGMVAKIRGKMAPYSTVIKVEDGHLYFSNGADVGIKKGLRYQVMRSTNNEFDDWDEGLTDGFKRQIGLVEVVEVAENKSMAKIIWNSEVIRSGDMLKESESQGWGIFALDIHTIGNPNETWVTYEGNFGFEVPFKSSGKVTTGFTPVPGIDDNLIWVWNFGFLMGWEVPIVPGTLYFEPLGGAGFAIANRSYSTFFGYNSVASAAGFYVNGGAGLKYYLDHENGIRLELAGIGQYGPFFYEWTDGDFIVIFSEPTVKISGFGWKFTVNVPL